MNNKELQTELGKHMIDILNAVDGENNRFEFGKTYFYFDYDNLEIKTFVSRYSCLALQSGTARIGNDEAWYCHVKNQQDVEFKRPVSALYSSPDLLHPLAITYIAQKKQESLNTLQTTITQYVDQHKQNIENYDEKQSKLEKILLLI